MLPISHHVRIGQLRLTAKQTQHACLPVAALGFATMMKHTETQNVSDAPKQFKTKGIFEATSA